MNKKNDCFLLKIAPFFIFPAGVFLFDLFLIYFKVYDVLPNLDIPMHFIGGLSIAYMSALFLIYFNDKNLIKIRNDFLFVFVVVSVVSFIAVLWEFFEFSLKVFFNLPFQPCLDDTLMDLLMGILGGFFGGAIFKFLYKL